MGACKICDLLTFPEHLPMIICLSSLIKQIQIAFQSCAWKAEEIVSVHVDVENI